MRMSASSSTIRMSCAMADRAQLHRLLRSIRVFGRPALGNGEDEPHPRAVRFPILQHQLALMIFQDLLDDGETQTGSLCSGRDVRLGQPLAALLRQAFAIVLDDYRRLTRRIANRHPDVSGRAR